MLFALLVFVVTVGCIVGIRWERWSFFDPVLPYDTSHYDYCSYKRCFHVKQLPESHSGPDKSNCSWSSIHSFNGISFLAPILVKYAPLPPSISAAFFLLTVFILFSSSTVFWNSGGCSFFKSRHACIEWKGQNQQADRGTSGKPASFMIL